MSDPVRMILRGLAHALRADVELIERCSTDWASITFTGGRHRLRLRSAVDPAQLATKIGDIDFPPRYHLVADIVPDNIVATDDGWLFDLEALTVTV